MTEVITTFSEDGYNLYGKKMIDTWLEYWPNNYKLTVYNEDYELSQKEPRLKTINLNDACPDLPLFKQHSYTLMQENNRKQNNRIKKTVKWCHKVFAMSHALKNTDSNHLIFLDGDTRTIKPIQNDLAENLVNDKLFAVHFEYLKKKLHFETGLVIFNMKHQLINWLAEEIVKKYNSLDIYEMDKTWDGFVFADIYQKNKLPVKDLSEGKQGVFCNRLIKNYIVHDVGPKKYAGTNYDRYLGKINDLGLSKKNL